MTTTLIIKSILRTDEISVLAQNVGGLCKIDLQPVCTRVLLLAELSVPNFTSCDQAARSGRCLVPACWGHNIQLRMSLIAPGNKTNLLLSLIYIYIYMLRRTCQVQILIATLFSSSNSCLQYSSWTCSLNKGNRLPRQAHLAHTSAPHGKRTPV